MVSAVGEAEGRLRAAAAGKVTDRGQARISGSVGLPADENAGPPLRMSHLISWQLRLLRLRGGRGKLPKKRPRVKPAQRLSPDEAAGSQ